MLEEAVQVCPEPLEMSPNKAARFFGRELVSESNSNIVQCKRAIFARNQPGDGARQLSNSKKDRQRQQGKQPDAGPIKQIYAVIHHQLAAQGTFARARLQSIYCVRGGGRFTSSRSSYRAARGRALASERRQARVADLARATPATAKHGRGSRRQITGKTMAMVYALV